jgi:phage terminase small subunit
MSKGKVLENGLTAKQEAFAVIFFETGNAAEAYRRAYDVSEKARDNWVYVEASQLVDHPKIANRLKELRDQATRLSIYTRHKAMEELEDARQLALREGQSGGAVSAVTAKIKLLGIDEPTRVEHTGKDGGPIEVVSPADRLKEKLDAIAERSAEASKPSGD